MHGELFLSAVEELGRLPCCLERLRALALELALRGFFSGDGGHEGVSHGWREMAIGDLAEVQSGNSIAASTKALKFEGLRDGYPYIATKDVDGRTGAIDYDNGVRIPIDQQGFRIAPPGSVLVCAEGGSAGKKVGLLDRAVCFGNKLFALTPRPNIESEFLLRLVQGRAFQTRFAAEKTGIIGGVALKRFKTIRLMLPSLEKQRDILAALTEVFAAFDRSEAARDARAKCARDVRDALASKLQESASSEAVGQLLGEFESLFESRESLNSLRQMIIDLTANGALTPGAPTTTKPLSQLVSFGPKNGYSPKPVSYETGTKTMSLSAVTSGRFDPASFKFVDEVIPPDSDLWVKPGDILIQRANTIDYVGVSARYTGAEREFIYPDLIMRITPSPEVDGEFLHLALLGSGARAFMRQRASGTSGTMPKVNQATVKAVPLAIPELGTQRQLAKLAHDLLNKCDDLARSLDAREERANAFIDGLFGCLENRVPPTPDHEPPPAPSPPAVDDSSVEYSPDEQPDAARMNVPAVSAPAYVDGRQEEAYLVSAVIRAFFEAGNEPIGNFRLQKGVYFARRWLGDDAVRSDFLRKAAGPYNPRMRYSGGIAIAKQLGWIREARGRFGFGHVPGAEQPERQKEKAYEEAATWVRDTFKLRKNDDWETLATIDYAALALSEHGDPVTPERVLAYIESDEEWRPKVARLTLSEFKVQSYLNELAALLPQHRSV